MSTQSRPKAMKHYDAFRRSRLTYGTDKMNEAAGVSGQAKSSDAVAAEAYWAACNHRVTGFVDRHYRWPGVYTLHRTAFGLDLLKAPVNVLLALPAVVVQVIGLALRRLGAYGAAQRLLSIPLGFQTSVEKALAERLRQEVLQLEAADWNEWQTLFMRSPSGSRSSPREERSIDSLGRRELCAAANALVDRYAETRRAASDVTTASLAGVAGAVLVGHFTPGSISAGRELAAIISYHEAVQGFLLGPMLGEWFYHIFPPDAGLWVEIVAMIAMVLLLSLVASFSGLLADPLQARVGLHHARLRRWLRTLRRLVGDSVKNDYRPWDPYVARLVDVVDAIRGLGSI